MKPNFVAEGASRYVAGKVGRFDQKNEMFCRTIWDPEVSEMGRQLWGKPGEPHETRPGYTLKDYALENAAWYLPIEYTEGNVVGNRGLYRWDTKLWGVYSKPKTGVSLPVDDLQKMTNAIKKIAKFFGASLVGVCELDRRWLYSHEYYIRTKEHTPIDIPEEYKYAIALAFEMDYELIRMSPTHTHGLTIGTGYARMAFVGSLLAQFIRLIGYKAIPMGNDTATSVPIAIDAGLGELGRLGVLITPELGPRIRLSKVFTNLPLVPDKPIEFGVWDFCMKCQKCARNCPGQAILCGEPTDQTNSISNREGVLRWPIQAEKCFAWFARNGGDCSNCIRVCPFNKPSGWHHSAVKWGVNNTRWLDSFFIRADDALGYGRQVKAERFWE
ncbi:reductive dehalogenase [Chloroflexota bacterium]